MNPFGHFDEELRARQYIEEVGEALAQDAARVMREHPDARLAGLILERGSPEWTEFRTRIEQETGVEITDDRFAGVVPRQVVERMIANSGASASASAGIDWLESDAPAYLDKLPILAVTKNGMQGAAVSMPGAP